MEAQARNQEFVVTGAWPFPSAPPPASSRWRTNTESAAVPGESGAWPKTSTERTNSKVEKTTASRLRRRVATSLARPPLAARRPTQS